MARRQYSTIVKCFVPGKAATHRFKVETRPSAPGEGRVRCCQFRKTTTRTKAATSKSTCHDEKYVRNRLEHVTSPWNNLAQLTWEVGCTRHGLFKRKAGSRVGSAKGRGKTLTNTSAATGKREIKGDGMAVRIFLVQTPKTKTSFWTEDGAETYMRQRQYTTL